MGLGNYASASRTLAEELEALLSEEDVVELADELGRLGFDALLAWTDQNELAIAQFAAATPSVRKRRKWSSSFERSLFVLAAATHCRMGQALLDVLVRSEPYLQAGGSYRDTTSSAGSIYLELWRTRIPYWPEAFLRWAPSPFDSD